MDIGETIVPDLHLSAELSSLAAWLERRMQLASNGREPVADIVFKLFAECRTAALLLVENQQAWARPTDKEATDKERAYAYLDAHPRAGADALLRAGIVKTHSSGYAFSNQWRKDRRW